MDNKNFNEVLKAREAAEQESKANEDSGYMALDDTQRVKVLSPGRLVFNRFKRNKLAIVGTAILTFMFLFSFLFPVFYSYGQTDIFYKYDTMMTDYASAAKRDSYTSYQVDPDHQVNSKIKNMMTSYVLTMEEEGTEKQEIKDEETDFVYYLNKLGENVYELTGIASEEVGTMSGFEKVCSFNSKTGKLMLTADQKAIPGLEAAAAAAIKSGNTVFEVGDKVYTMTSSGKKGLYSIYDLSSCVLKMADGSESDNALRSAVLHGVAEGKFTYEGESYGVQSGSDKFTVVKYTDASALMLSSKYVFNAYQIGTEFTDGFKAAVLEALYGEHEFEYEGASYTVSKKDDEFIVTGPNGEYAELCLYSVRRYNGEDTLSIDFKRTVQKEIEKLESAGQKKGVFTYAIPKMDDEGKYIVKEDGSYELEDVEMNITRKEGQYVLKCERTAHLIDIYGPASSKHIFGTDADGMDILARMMYGGRISLMVGFIVVALELLFGVIMGGLAGFFSGWVDTLIMRLVDIFNCIPTLPILIILGAIFDDQKLNSYVRLMWMMAVLGFLGWAGVARLVRGQILSLREQEFMTAAEATGLSTTRRIFRHLVPNVIPQLIVNATMGLGSVIIYESTLSFLGLGVKHPLATWGTMINSVTSSNENMVRYAYIWIPVGLLICLTVIAFNFVGDGLRDAFDPKMK